ncbi:hypothetical protein KD050_00770 [Psychrobacillus sp. INOP01]|uniref:hypothetical protein n=1 Tax=Psychrobacillus sp. INOP01 TaxID=2829187 RepID=UPI001BA4D3F1|nr:hypothetical protein [Psychrobacillus sp. INOP01]QUG41871.1 hypothetical protein KD050_00770 [Psychrobacillus sp. INOP01]
MKKKEVDQSGYYDQQLLPIDNQLCELLKQRKELSNNNPGVPPIEYISEWSDKYGVYEDLLNSLFWLLRNEESFRPQVEPNNFRRHLPVMKVIENAERLYSVTFIRQFDNASVVYLTIDWEDTNNSDPLEEIRRSRYEGAFHLYINENYDCRPTGGRGSGGHSTQKFVVSPPLPDDLTGLSLVFTEYTDHLKEKPTGLEFVINLE